MRNLTKVAILLTGVSLLSVGVLAQGILQPNQVLGNPTGNPAPAQGMSDSITINTITCTLASSCTVTIANVASGQTAMGTGSVSSATCATVVTATATGTLTTDTIIASFNGDPTAVTGYIPSVSGMLTIIAYPTANTANFKVCNNTTSAITPGAITLNWRVIR